MEIILPFSNLGINAGTLKTIGFMLGIGWPCPINDSQQPNVDYWLYPTSGGYKTPSTWADMLISFPTTVIKNHEQENEINIFPNPSATSTTIQFPNPENEPHTLIIYNSSFAHL